MTMRTFFRFSDDNQNWWHWRPKCLVWMNRGDKKKRGKTVTTTTVSGGRPTTYRLCPACTAEDERIRTHDESVYVKRTIRGTATPVGSVTLPVGPGFRKNPFTTTVVRHDEST